MMKPLNLTKALNLRDLDLKLEKEKKEKEKNKNEKKEKENVKLPMIGEKVRLEILEVDELEVKCWLADYSMLGYIDNSSHSYDLRDVGRFYSFMQVCSTYEGVIWIKNPRILVTNNGMGGEDIHKYIELL